MKDYKKILEGVIDIISATEKSDIGFANICTYIGENCPELKESEDEKIKGAIIDHLKDSNLIEWAAWLEKQGEQKSAWSEEDEKILRTIISDGIRGAEFDMLQIGWLKSLKQRYTWKPSEKQMHAFEQVYDWYNNNFAPSETLTSLYDDLKKLKGE